MANETVETVEALPWLPQAVELEALATAAQNQKWSAEQSARAAALPGEITGLMAAQVEPPIEPPTIPPEPITPEPPIVMPGDKLIRAKYPPPAARELKATPTTLTNVYRNAQPGDHIVLEDGNYSAGYKFDRTFPGNQKVVIRSKNTLGADFGVAVRFFGRGHWLHDVTTSFDSGTDKDSFNIKLEADDINVTKCDIKGKDGIASRAGAVRNIQVGWNRFTGKNKYASRADHVYFWLPQAGDYIKPTDGPNNISIHYNFFDDPLARGAEDHSLYFGDTKANPGDVPMMENVFVDYNYWPATNKRTRPMYLKRGCYVRRNTCLSTERNFGIRHGQESKVWGNIIKGSYFMFAGAMVVGASADHHHDIRGNDAPNADLILFCGSKTTSDYCAASYALAVSNKLRSIQVGVRQGSRVQAAQGGFTKGVKIYLDGKMKRSAVALLSCEAKTIGIDDGVGDLWVPSTYPLTPEMVGLERR